VRRLARSSSEWLHLHCPDKKSYWVGIKGIPLMREFIVLTFYSSYGKSMIIIIKNRYWRWLKIIIVTGNKFRSLQWPSPLATVFYHETVVVHSVCLKLTTLTAIFSKHHKIYLYVGMSQTRHDFKSHDRTLQSEELFRQTWYKENNKFRKQEHDSTTNPL